MLAFLRKIRKSSINSGSVTKYLFYALGEITLVVIGILIALQLNNWNENRKSSKSETEYLVALKDEFDENLLNLNENIKTNHRVMQGMRNMLTLTGPSPSTTEDEWNLVLVQIMQEIVNYEPTQAVLDDLISSGNLSKISDMKLRRLISEGKAYLNRVTRQERTIRDFRLDVIEIIDGNGLTRPLVYEGINIEPSKFNTSPDSVLRDPKFDSLISNMLRYSVTLEIVYEKMKNILEEIRDLITQQFEDDRSQSN